MRIAARRWPLVAVPVAYVLLLCLPALLSGKGLVLGGPSGDLFLQFVQQREFGFGELAHGRIPLWNPHLFSGMPALGNIQLALCYPLNLIFLVLPLAAAFNVSIMVHLALAGVLMGFWVRSRGGSLLPALAAGILYLGCGAHFSHVLAGHQTMICLLPWAPLLFMSIDAVTRDGRPGPVLGGATAVALMLLAGYPQFVFHIGVAAALYALLRLAGTDHRLRKGLLLAAIPLLAAGVSAFQLAATAQAAAGTLRGGRLPFDYAAMFALPPENLLTLLAPYPWGGAGGEGYWGRWYLWETQLFFGITGLVMALVGLGRKADRDRWWLFALAVLMILLALGDATPLFRVLYDYAPPFGDFRGHSKWILPASLFLILLAARGIESFLAEPAKHRSLPWLLAAAAGATGTGAALLERGAGQTPPWWQSFLQGITLAGGSYQLTPDLLAQEGFLGSSAHSAAIALSIAAVSFAALAIIAAFARRRPGFAVAAVGLALLELFIFDRSYLATFPIDLARRGEVAAALAREPGDYRIHVPDNPNSAMSTGALDIWGYDPFVPRRYAEFIAYSQGLPLDTPAVDIPIRRWDPLLSLLRFRYLFAPTPEGGLKTWGPFAHLPHALLVPEYRMVSGPREALLDSLHRADFDPERTVLLEETPNLPARMPPHKEAGRPYVRTRTLFTDEIEVEAETGQPALLLLTDPAFPGWQASALPGSSQGAYRILQADYILQAIPLEAGTHRIKLRYAPPGRGIGGATSLCTMLGIAIAGMVIWRRKRLPTVEPNAS